MYGTSDESDGKCDRRYRNTLTVYSKRSSEGGATVTTVSSADSTKNTSCKVTVGASIPDPTAYIVTFAGNGKTKDVGVESFPRTITADWLSENGELDKIIKGLYNFSGYCREAVPTSSDTDKVTGAVSSKKDQYITINNAFDGTVTVDFLYYNDKTDTDVTYTVQISVTDAYTITWKNDDGTTIDTTYAVAGAVPTHADPTKEDDDYTYTFEGWTDGTDTYDVGTDLPGVTGDTTYTAQFTYVPKYEIGYYIIGTMTDWKVDPDYQLTQNDDTEITEYVYSTSELTTESEFKVVFASPGEEKTWFPYLGDNYGQNGEIAADGSYTVYFRPDYNGGDDWFCKTIYVAPDAYEESKAVIEAINALPTVISFSDKYAVEAARAAYEALTDDQKRFIGHNTLAKLEAAEEVLAAADQAAAFDALTDDQKRFIDYNTLAKLEAAEEVLLLKLVNNSEIVTIAPTVGEKISVKDAASGGSGDYTYAFYYKKSSKTDWYAMAEPYTTNRAAFKPSMAVKYDVKVVVKDADGKTEEKIFTVKVKAPLVNNSEILTTEPVVGEKVRVKGAASGGSGSYIYAFYYKKTSKTDWYKMAEPFTTKTAAFKPTSAVSYDIKVVVIDTEGRTAEEIRTVDVTK